MNYRQFAKPIRVRHKHINVYGIAIGYLPGTAEEYTRVVVEWTDGRYLLNNRCYPHNLVFRVPAPTRRVA